MIAFVLQHQVGATIVAYFVFLSAVNALPQPAGSAPYRFLFDFAHGLSANLMKLRSLRGVTETNPSEPAVAGQSAGK